MILGGVDDNGPALFTIDMDNLPNRVSFAALGSGSSEALSVLEIARRNWRMKLYNNDRSRSNDDVVNSRPNDTFINSNSSNDNNNQINNNRINNNFNQARSPSFGNQYNNNHNIYKEQINVSDAIPIIRRAVQAGILNDLGSGSHVDFCVVTYNYTKQWREYLLSTWDDNRLNKSTIIMNYNDNKEKLRKGIDNYERVSSSDGSSSSSSRSGSSSSSNSSDDGGNSSSDSSDYDVICSDDNYNCTSTATTTASTTSNTVSTVSANIDNSSTETLLGRRIFSKQKLIKRLVKGKMIEELTDNDTYFLDQDLSLNIQLVKHN